MKKLYKIYQDENSAENTYSSAIVVASSEFQAKRIHPSSIATQEEGHIIIFNLQEKKWELLNEEGEVLQSFETDSTWTDIGNVKTEYLGEYKEELNKEKIIIVSSL